MNRQPSDSTAATQPTTPQPRPRWMRMLGLRPRPAGRFLRVAPTTGGWILWTVVLAIGGAAAFAEYSMQPDFCRSCHLMEPYYEAWHGSTHKNVPCALCHFEPGFKNTLKGKWQASSQAIKYITQTYGSKPHAEIQDASCMRSGCHERRLLEGKVNWEVPTVRGGTITIRFDHTPHLQSERRGKQLRCVSCHSQIVQGQHLVVTLDTCFLCHMKGFEHGRNQQTLTGCRSCHDAPKQQIRLATGMFNHSDYLDRGVGCENCHSDVVKGDGEVRQQVCWTCHNVAKFVQRFNESGFLHRKHVTEHKVECSNCHVQIEHHLTAGMARDIKTMQGSRAVLDTGTCQSCHELTHSGPAEMYRGSGARGIAEMPSPMYRAQVDCIACHKAKKQPGEAAEIVGQTFVAMQQACNDCHGARYQGTLDTWRELIASKLAQAQGEYDAARAAVDAAPLNPTERLKADRLLDDAAHNIRFVRLGHGVHNINYATAALNIAIEWSRQARRLAENRQTAGAGP